MKVVFNEKEYNAAYINEMINVSMGTREISMDIKGASMDSVYADIKAHGAGKPIAVIRDDKEDTTINGYKSMKTVSRNITPDDDTIRVELSLPTDPDQQQPVDEEPVEATEEAE